jgi:hypothetical protein
MQTPRGIRNNNPGNIRYDGTKWRGLDRPPTDGAFCRFSDAKHGIRAMAVILKNYNAKHGIGNIAQVIGRWAPPNENNTQSYIASVCAALGRSANDPISFSDKNTLLRLCAAIIRHENGKCPYDNAEIAAALEL